MSNVNRFKDGINKQNTGKGALLLVDIKGEEHVILVTRQRKLPNFYENTDQPIRYEGFDFTEAERTSDTFTTEFKSDQVLQVIQAPIDFTRTVHGMIRGTK